MSTCTELPQLGCCDGADEPYISPGYHYVTISTPLLNPTALTPVQLPAIFARMRRIISEVDLPAASFVRVMQYDIGTGIGTTIRDEEIGLNPTSLDFPFVGQAYAFPNQGTVLAANRFSFSLKWAVWASRLVYKLPKSGTASFLAAYPVCIWERTLVDTCIRSRMLSPDSELFAINPETGRAGYKWRLVDDGQYLTFENNGSNEEFAASELTLDGAGRMQLQHNQWWGYSYRNTSSPGGFVAACCDLSPLPP